MLLGVILLEPAQALKSLAIDCLTLMVFCLTMKLVDRVTKMNESLLESTRAKDMNIQMIKGANYSTQGVIVLDKLANKILLLNTKAQSILTDLNRT